MRILPSSRFYTLVMFSLLMAGCSLLDVRDTVTYDHDQRPVPEEVVDGVRPGITTKEWLLDNLGEPDEVTVGKNKTEIFTYRFAEKKLQRIRLFLVFQYKKKDVTERHVYVHFDEQGVVQRYWRDYELPAVPEDEFEFPDELREEEAMEAKAAAQETDEEME